MNRAYSILTVKSINEKSRVIEGIASTASPDHVGDIVEPNGAQFKLPLPLLWQHDSAAPIGHVETANVGTSGIKITARLVKVSEPGVLKDRLDEAWQAIKSGLVRGLSIGFNVIEATRLSNSSGMHIKRWAWLELSAVTLACNAEATITAVKSADELLRAAAIRGKRRVVYLNKPGRSGAVYL